MRIRTALRALCLVATLALSAIAQAQLPDLRGQSLYFTGTLDVTGIAFGLNFGDLAPGGISLVKNNQARLSIDSAGPEDNSTLTGGLKLPVFPDSDGTCVNPTIPMTGSFNRTTGAFTLSGTIAGESFFDFGVANIPNLGEQRIQVRFTNLSLTLSGTGSLDAQGNFTLKNPGSNALTFVSSAGTPKLALGPTTTCAFGALQDTVTSAILGFRNWTASQATVSGKVTLEECPDSAHPVLLTFCPVAGEDAFTRIATPAANGDYTVRNVGPGKYNVGLKGSHWLQKVVLNVDTTTTDATGVNATLASGDATNDNSIDVLDLAALIEAFDAAEGDPNWNEGVADFNCDGTVDVLDLDVLIRNFDKSGEECP